MTGISRADSLIYRALFEFEALLQEEQQQKENEGPNRSNSRECDGELSITVASFTTADNGNNRKYDARWTDERDPDEPQPIEEEPEHAIFGKSSQFIISVDQLVLSMQSAFFI